MQEADLRSHGVCSKMEISNFEFLSANRITNLDEKIQAVCRISLKPKPGRDPWRDDSVLVSPSPPLPLRLHFSPSRIHSCSILEQYNPPLLSTEYASTPPPMSAYCSQPYPDYSLQHFSPLVNCSPSSIPLSHTSLPRPISRNTRRQSLVPLITMSILPSLRQPSPSPTSTVNNPPSSISTSPKTLMPTRPDLTTPQVPQAPAAISQPQFWSRGCRPIRVRPAICAVFVRTPVQCL